MHCADRQAIAFSSHSTLRGNLESGIGCTADPILHCVVEAEFSVGMQQRMGLARALTHDALILLMDQAYPALDPLIRVDMQTQIRTTRKSNTIRRIPRLRS